jgi:hypothetical protein
MSHGGLVEISEALGDSRLQAVLEVVYRASREAPMGLALPWEFRWRVNRLPDPTVRRHGIGGETGLFPGVHYLDVDGDVAMEWAVTAPLVITCTDAFRARLERKGVPFLRFPEGIPRLTGSGPGPPVSPPPKRRTGTLAGRKGFSSLLVTSS